MLRIECLQKRIRAIPKEQGGGQRVGSTIELPDSRGIYSKYRFKPVDPTNPLSAHVCEFDPVKQAVQVAKLLAITEGFRVYDPDAPDEEPAAPAGDPIAQNVGLEDGPATDTKSLAVYTGDLPDFDAFPNKKKLYEWIVENIPALAEHANASLPMGRLGQMVRDAHAAGHKA